MLKRISIPTIRKEKIEAVRDIIVKQRDQAYNKMTGNCKDYYHDDFISEIDFSQMGFTPEELEQALEYEKLKAQYDILNKIIWDRFYYEPIEE